MNCKNESYFLLVTLYRLLIWTQTSSIETDKLSETSLRVICYFTNWAQYRPGAGLFTPSDINANLCSHIYYAFANINGGILAPYEWDDDTTPWKKGLYEMVTDLKKVKPSLKVVLSVGGWNMGSAPFVSVVATDQNRKKFITDAIQYLRKRNFDGLDIDWEYPANRGSSPGDKQLFTLFVQELRGEFELEAVNTNQTRLLLTAAVPAGMNNTSSGYEVDKISQSLDFLNLMGYDLHGSWEQVTGLNSPLYPRSGEKGYDLTLNQDWAVRNWLNLGAPKEKLNLGVAIYGRSFTLVNATNHTIGAPANSAGKAGEFTRTPGFLSYYEICSRLKSGWTRVWEDEQKTPYAYMDTQWVGYDDIESITIKANYIRSMGLGGVMIWTLALDDFNGTFCNTGQDPMISTIHKILNAGTT